MSRTLRIRFRLFWKRFRIERPFHHPHIPLRVPVIDGGAVIKCVATESKLVVYRVPLSTEAGVDFNFELLPLHSGETSDLK